MRNYFENLTPQTPDELIKKLSQKSQDLYDYFGDNIYGNSDRAYLDKQIDNLKIKF